MPPSGGDRAAARFSFNGTPDLLAAWGLTASSLIETPISRADALQVPAVQRARNLIAGTIATLPLQARDLNRRPVRRALLEQPEAVTTRAVTIGHTVADLLFESVAWWRVLERDAYGFPTKVMRLDPAIVTVPQVAAPVTQSQFTEVPVPYGPAYVNGVRIPDPDIIRFDSPLPPLLRAGARAIRTCLRLDVTAALYSDNPLPLEFFTPTEGADPVDDDAVLDLLTAWQSARKTRSAAYVPAAVKHNQLMPMTAEQIQLADSRQHAVLEIARACGIDPEDLGVSTTSRTYQNAVDRRLDFITFTLAPFLHAVEDRLTLPDVTPVGQAVRFVTAELERANRLQRFQTYATGLGINAITEDEIRVEENRPSIPKAAQVVVAPPTLTPQRIRQEAEPAAATFTATVLGFEVDTATHFMVDASKRVIAGLAVPYGPSAKSQGKRYRFAQGSLRWSDVGRVKLLRDHDYSQAVGKAISLDDTPAGLIARFKIAHGPAGDEVLSLAADGVLDGLSVGIDFEADGLVDDPTEPGVLLVQRAALREITLTAMPSFDSARLSSVAAEADPVQGRFDMPPTETVTPPAAPAAPDLTAFTAALDAGFTRLLERLPAPQAPAGPAVIPSSHPGSTDGLGFQVTEPSVYTFTPGRGRHSFVRDMWTAKVDGDAEALARLGKFRKQQEEVANFVAERSAAEFTQGTRANIPAVIPPGYRPEMYVSQLLQGRPFMDALSKGDLTDATPFVIPKFATATGLSADNVEGTNPVDGTITATTVTVNPVAISGLFKVSRELIDASNPAIDAIALQAMREDYSQRTEAKCYAKLNGANGVGGVVTAGFVPSGAAVRLATGAAAGLSDDGVATLRQLRLQLAEYPFRRFASADRLLLSSEGLQVLASAEDTTGRPLLPPLAPYNAAGTVQNLGTPQQGVNVDGIAGVPAWSITGNAAGDADTFLWNHMDAWAWESGLLLFRFEERSGPGSIELALWGYHAVEVLRASGFSAIRITAVP